MTRRWTYCKSRAPVLRQPRQFCRRAVHHRGKEHGRRHQKRHAAHPGRASRSPARRHEPGLWLLDSTPDPHWMQFGITNPNDNEGLMDLISCGAHIVFLVTGRGNVVGSAVSPLHQDHGQPAHTYVRMEEDMDFDASPVLEGVCSQDEMALRLARDGGRHWPPDRRPRARHWATGSILFPTNIRKNRSL